MAEAVGIKVEGLKETLSALKKLGDNFEDLKDANAELSSTIASKASALAPKLTGALAGSIKGNRANKRVQIKAGSAKIAYAGVIEYGYPKRNIRAQSYLRRAASEDQNYIAQTYETNIKEVIKKYNFD